jgi:integrase
VAVSRSGRRTAPGRPPLHRGEARRTFGPPKSRRSERTIALDPATVEALRSHQDAQRVEKELAGDAYQDGDLVFCNELGQPIHPTTLGEWFTAHRDGVNIPVGTMHTLRHTAATLMLTNGIPLHVAAMRPGDDPKTILDTYAHLLPQSDQAAADVVAAVLVA